MEKKLEDMTREELLGIAKKDQENRRKYWRKAQIRKELLERKCEEAGIVVKESEVEVEYKRKYGSK